MTRIPETSALVLKKTDVYKRQIRSSILIFSYQLRHIGVGKHNMGKRVKAVKPELEPVSYTHLDVYKRQS